MSIFGDRVRAKRRGLLSDSIVQRGPTAGPVKYLYATAGTNGGVLSIDVDTGEILQAFEGRYSSVCALPDGSGFVTNRSSPHEILAFSLGLSDLRAIAGGGGWAYDNIIMDSATSPDGCVLILTQRFLIKYTAGGAREWDLQLSSGAYVPRRLVVVASGSIYVTGTYAHTRGRVLRWRISPDGDKVWEHVGTTYGSDTGFGQSIAVSEEDGLVYIGYEARGGLFVCSAETGDEVYKITVGAPIPTGSRSHGARLTPDKLLYLSAGNSVVIWDISDAATANVVDIYTPPDNDPDILDLAPLPDGGFVYLSSGRFIRRITSNFQRLWHTQLPGTGNVSIEASIACYPARYESFPELW